MVNTTSQKHLLRDGACAPTCRQRRRQPNQQLNSIASKAVSRKQSVHAATNTYSLERLKKNQSTRCDSSFVEAHSSDKCPHVQAPFASVVLRGATPPSPNNRAPVHISTKTTRLSPRTSPRPPLSAPHKTSTPTQTRRRARVSARTWRSARPPRGTPRGGCPGRTCCR